MRGQCKTSISAANLLCWNCSSRLPFDGPRHENGSETHQLSRVLKAFFATERLLPIIIIIFLAALLTLPMLLDGFWPFSWDALLHTNWYYNFSHQVWEGELYPRWLPGLNKGMGSPVFFYYPPLPYWMTCLARPFVWNDPVGWRQLGISSFLALALSGLGCFGWLKPLTNKLPALMAAILFMLMPYHLRTDLYVRGAFAEFWAFAWIPFVLWTTSRVIHGSQRALIGLASSYAALCMTHLPTTLIFSPVFLSYGAVLSLKIGHKRSFLKVVFGLGLGTGLAAIYLVPALTMQSYVNMEALGDVGFYSNSFFFAGFSFQTMGLGDDFKRQMLWLTISTLGTAAGSVWILRGSKVSPYQVLFWSVVSAFAFFMMLPLSNGVWRLLTPLQIIQFPWRFNTMLCTGCAALIAFALRSAPIPLRRAVMIPMGVIYLCVSMWVYFTACAVWPKHFVGRPVAAKARITTIDAPEYRARTAPASRDNVVEEFGRPPGKRLQATLGQNIYSADKSEGGRHFIFQVDSSTNAPLVVHHFYYPGWAAETDGIATPIQASVPDGLMTMNVPPGPHTISFRLRALPPERWGRLTSAVSLFLSVAVYLRSRAKPLIDGPSAASAPMTG